MTSHRASLVASFVGMLLASSCRTLPTRAYSLPEQGASFVELREHFFLTGLGGSVAWTRDGVTISGGPGALALVLEHTDYRVNVDVMVEEGGNSGVFVRSAAGALFPDGVEVQIDPHDPKNFTGSIYNRAKTRAPVPPPGTWFHLEIVVRGARVESYVDGKLAAAIDDAKPYGPLFALQAHHPGSVAHFKALVIERLE